MCIYIIFTTSRCLDPFFITASNILGRFSAPRPIFTRTCLSTRCIQSSVSCTTCILTTLTLLALTFSSVLCPISFIMVKCLRDIRHIADTLPPINESLLAQLVERVTSIVDIYDEVSRSSRLEGNVFNPFHTSGKVLINLHLAMYGAKHLRVL